MSKFKDIEKLKGGQGDGAGQGAKIENPAETPVQTPQAASPAPKPTAKPKAAPRARVKPDAAPERLTVTISPKSAVYDALVTAREGFPKQFQSQTLSSVLLNYLAENDANLAKKIGAYFNDV